MFSLKKMNKMKLICEKKYQNIKFYFFIFTGAIKLNYLVCPVIPVQVYSREELEMIAELCKKYNTIAVMDEVYEWMTYTGEKHVRMGE